MTVNSKLVMDPNFLIMFRSRQSRWVTLAAPTRFSHEYYRFTLLQSIQHRSCKCSIGGTRTITNSSSGNTGRRKHLIRYGYREEKKVRHETYRNIRTYAVGVEGGCTGSHYQRSNIAAQHGLGNRQRYNKMMSTITTTSTTTNVNDNKLNSTSEENRRYILLSANIQNKLHSSIERYDAIMNDMKRSGTSSSPSMIITYSVQQELSSLSEVYKLFQQHTSKHDEMISYYELIYEVQQQIQQHAESLSDNNDVENESNNEILKDCSNEIRRLTNEKVLIEKLIINAILPKDLEDMNHDAIIEIRAGTGGDEASLFAREIWDCYMKCIKTISKQWKVDVLSETTTDLGGLKDGTILITGHPISIEFNTNISVATSLPDSSNNMESNDDDKYGNVDDGDDVLLTSSDSIQSSNEPISTTTEEIGPYGFFKFESGVHRVQRIPINATRIHTSACSIAVLPSMKDSDSNDKNNADLLPMSELRIETMRSHGAGGQHVNTTDSAVRITHIPTGIQASIQDERSQHKNKAKALKLITARVRDLKRIEQEQKLGLQKSLLMGGGDRSERIRTYNYPQDRITDHRCKISIQNIQSILSCQNHSLEDGLVICFLPHLKMMRRQELLEQLENLK